jgi:hypothetical protein
MGRSFVFSRERPLVHDPSFRRLVAILIPTRHEYFVRMRIHCKSPARISIFSRLTSVVAIHQPAKKNAMIEKARKTNHREDEPITKMPIGSSSRLFVANQPSQLL